MSVASLWPCNITSSDSTLLGLLAAAYRNKIIYIKSYVKRLCMYPKFYYLFRDNTRLTRTFDRSFRPIIHYVYIILRENMESPVVSAWKVPIMCSLFCAHVK